MELLLQQVSVLSRSQLATEFPDAAGASAHISVTDPAGSFRCVPEADMVSPPPSPQMSPSETKDIEKQIHELDRQAALARIKERHNAFVQSASKRARWADDLDDTDAPCAKVYEVDLDPD